MMSILSSIFLYNYNNTNNSSNIIINNNTRSCHYYCENNFIYINISIYIITYVSILILYASYFTKAKLSLIISNNNLYNAIYYFILIPTHILSIIVLADYILIVGIINYCCIPPYLAFLLLFGGILFIIPFIKAYKKMNNNSHIIDYINSSINSNNSNNSNNINNSNNSNIDTNIDTNVITI